jgi:hypothetical protein
MKAADEAVLKIVHIKIKKYVNGLATSQGMNNFKMKLFLLLPRIRPRAFALCTFIST